MTAKGYTTKENVAAFLGVAFTSAQNAHCESLIERAEKRIDRYCGRAWIVGAQADEAHYDPGADLYLKYPPASGVTAVKGRAGVGATETTLVDGTDYEVRDLETGHIRLEQAAGYDRVRVSYTVPNTAPLDITQAATELVAAWMREHLHPNTYGVDSYQLPDLQVRFAKAEQDGLPASVTAILDEHRHPVHA